MKSSQNPEVFSQAYNFGPESSSCLDVESILFWENNDLSKLIIKLSLQLSLHEARLLMLDSSKSRINLGWKSKFDIHPSSPKLRNGMKHF